jgi:hypothetical protein
MTIASSETPSPRLYEPPIVRELSPEEAITILSRLASEGDTEAGVVLQQFLAANPRLAA